MFKDIKKLHQICCLLAVAAVVLLMPFLMGFDITRHITVKYDGLSKEVRTNLERPESIIREAGVTLRQGDSWRLLGANSRVQDGSVIEVLRAKEFIVLRDGKEEIYTSSKATVGEALKSIGVAFNKKRIYPEATAELKPGMRIFVLNKNERLDLKEAPTDIPVEYVDDLNMAWGTQQVQSAGKAGTAVVVSSVAKAADGSIISRELGRHVIVEPEKKIVKKGLAQSVQTPEGYKRYKRKMVVETSAYTPACGSGTGRTAIGLVPYEGIVAVDPRVIPFYTKMYIPGYGIAMAGDTGGAIIGNRVDLFMNTYQEAIQWGRRDVEIYILED